MYIYIIYIIAFYGCVNPLVTILERERVIRNVIKTRVYRVWYVQRLIPYMHGGGGDHLAFGVRPYHIPALSNQNILPRPCLDVN